MREHKVHRHAYFYISGYNNVLTKSNVFFIYMLLFYATLKAILTCVYSSFENANGSLLMLQSIYTYFETTPVLLWSIKYCIIVICNILGLESRAKF